MPDTTPKSVDKNVPDPNDRDRVVGLSIAKDGTLDQNNPEIIGDRDTVLEATKEQFRQIAVSAIDQEAREKLGLSGQEDGDTSDAAIDALRKEHEKAEVAADKQAEAIVKALA